MNRFRMLPVIVLLLQSQDEKEVLSIDGLKFRIIFSIKLAAK